jgi:hypothetical protein
MSTPKKPAPAERRAILDQMTRDAEDQGDYNKFYDDGRTRAQREAAEASRQRVVDRAQELGIYDDFEPRVRKDDDK